MKIPVRILLAILIMLSAGHRGYSQAESQSQDTLRVQAREKRNPADDQGQARKGYAYGQAARENGSKTAKQVRGSRPDLSRAKGARPPSIVRPSGSGVPKGIGKPGGAGRKGGR
ncbi:MAG TPA: hypothetical protein PLX08_06655 [Bacteroidales bacterium]|nr:hypothetical protein [Bacteroidales bacterium]